MSNQKKNKDPFQLRGVGGLSTTKIYGESKKVIQADLFFYFFKKPSKADLIHRSQPFIYAPRDLRKEKKNHPSRSFTSTD